MFTWTGFYAGLNAGYGWGKKTSLQGDVAGSVTNAFLGAFFTGNAAFAQPLATHAVDPKMIGLFVGLQAGYNRQVSARWVVGVEADIQTSFENSKFARSNTLTAGFPFTLNVNNQVKWFSTLRGRIGILARSNLLLFATGGLALGQISSYGVHTNNFVGGVGGLGQFCPANSQCFAGRQTKTSVGWVVGAGLEWKIKPNWSLKAEYLHVDLGKTSYNMVTVPPSGVLGFWRVRNNNAFDLVRIGLNYHFGSRASAVVAKY